MDLFHEFLQLFELGFALIKPGIADDVSDGGNTRENQPAVVFGYGL